MRTVNRLGVLTLIAALASGPCCGVRGTIAESVWPNVPVTSATPSQLRMVRWAVGRFEIAGLDAPSVDIHFDEGVTGCRGNIGYALAGRVDLCTSLVNAMARRVVLHEMAHVWLDENLEPTIRDHFLQARRLSSWNDTSDPWPMRGYEQGAEIMSWCLGERILTAQIPDNDPTQLAAAFQLLTGVAAPGPIADASGPPAPSTN